VTALEQELRAVAFDVEWPSTPDLETVVAERIAGAPVERRRPSWLRPLAIAAAVLIVAAGAVLAFTPGARSAVLRFFHLQGATVVRVDELPPIQSGAGLGLGLLMPREDAQRTVGFALRLPPDHRPDRVYLDPQIGRGAVSVVWCCPRVVLTQFVGEATPYVEKMAGPGTSIEYVLVGDHAGVWVAGRAHAVIFRDETGTIRDRPRLAKNVLLWEDGRVTLRLEGDFTKARALAIARSLRQG
jgi:hypothetical protein